MIVRIFDDDFNGQISDSEANSHGLEFSKRFFSEKAIIKTWEKLTLRNFQA